jgi:hypothetical protein
MPGADAGAAQSSTHSHGGPWLVAAVLFAFIAALGALGVVWSLLVKGDWWPLVSLPIAGLFWYWLIAGSLHRAQR